MKEKYIDDNDEKDDKQNSENEENEEERSCIQQMKEKWKSIFNQIKNFSFF